MARPGDATIDPARWERIQALFHEAADLPAAEQAGLLAHRCGQDEDLRAAVAAMLEEDRGTSLLDRDLSHTAAQLFGAGGSPALPLEHFGPYQIRQVLGEGGMGVVYLAGRDDLSSVAAIKILRDAWLSPSRRERFASEQRTLAQLNHPAIARLYDADTLGDGTPWFAMEYVEGVPLTTFCAEPALPLAARLRLFRNVCEAVQHAHQHLIVHRDLKPSNILVTPDGAVKLLDFGIAKQLESLDPPKDQTRTGLRLMTPAYAAPEQIRGGRVGIHTDVYALGVVLYELLTDRLPFELSNRTPGEVEAAIVAQEPERPSAAARQIGSLRGAGKAAWVDLDVLCLTAMHKEPERRYQTVEALIRDVDHFLAGEPLEAQPDTLGYRLGKFVRRNRARVAAAALTLTVVVGLVVFYTVRLAGARNAALAEAARAQRIQRFTLNLFEGGDKEVGPADSLRVVTLVDRGLQEARTLTAEPRVQAELYGTLGSIYQKLGNLARADTLLRAAFEQGTSLFKPGSAELTESGVALGLLRVDQAKLEEAEQLIRGALEAGKRSLPAGHPALARATYALGSVLQARGRYQQAIHTSEEAARLYRAADGPPTPELAASLGQLADDHFYAGHYELSDSVNLQVLEMYRQLYGERHPLVAGILINLGASQFQRGKYAEAERFDRQGLGIIESFYGANHRETAYALTQLGRALVFEKKFGDGVAVLTQALAINERVFGPQHPAVASTLNELGNAAYYRDDFAAAAANFGRMVEIYRKVYGEKHHLFGIALSNLAGVFTARKQYAQAEQMFRNVVAIFTAAQGPEHVNTGIARIKLGRALLRQSHYAEAAAESLAGYQIVSKLSDSRVAYLVNARKDLVLAYDSLKQPEKAARFRAELADTLPKAVARK
ncbi:MAG TPA: serine/threonine-protein kinase [Gemmatimonadales bacterium]|jgi:serine/threonine-protein kinase|nr:serine/threonine-protein kinase [Gemmatimonadales bacterium]